MNYNFKFYVNDSKTLSELLFEFLDYLVTSGIISNFHFGFAYSMIIRPFMSKNFDIRLKKGE